MGPKSPALLGLKGIIWTIFCPCFAVNSLILEFPVFAILWSKYFVSNWLGGVLYDT